MPSRGGAPGLRHKFADFLLSLPRRSAFTSRRSLPCLVTTGRFTSWAARAAQSHWSGL